MGNIQTLPMQKNYRIQSIDLLRGIVMIIMALDHTRDYFHWSAMIYNPTDLDHTSVVIFFTRWITHFCAPVFIFLAGTSAFLVGQRKSKKELSVFLFTRGLWLIIMELTLLNFGWYLNIHFTFLVLQVIWALGISMIVLSALIHLPKKIILILSLVIICLHNLLDNFHFGGENIEGFLWSAVNEQHEFKLGDHLLRLGYPFVPWLGIMMAGYCFGSFYVKDFDVKKRKKILISIGIVTICLFVIIRAINLYGDRHSWSLQPSSIYTILSFLNVSKYPPSLLYTLMTLGPAILFLALAETTSGKIIKPLIHIGRVPFFFYIIHIYLIHLLAMITIEFFPGYNWSNMILRNWPDNTPELKGYGFSLAIVYIVWISIIIFIYPLCKWYDRYKTAHKEKWWLSYL